MTTLALTVVFASTASAATITNGSFETGNFFGWVVRDLANPYSPLVVTDAESNTYSWSWSSMPTDGSYTAFSGFDGAGPGTITIAQDIGIVGDALYLIFDYRAAWNLRNFCSNCDGRSFDVRIQSALDSSQLGSFNFINATPNSYQDDTGALTGSVDMSAFIGQDVWISFELLVPNNFSGPAQFQLDNIQLSNEVPDNIQLPNEVPEPFSLALFGIGGLGIGAAHRRKQ